MNNNGFSDTLIIGYEHNWDDAGEYPVQLVSAWLLGLAPREYADFRAS